jgi:hypothetical protein
MAEAKILTTTGDGAAIPTVFYAWQSDVKPNRGFIAHALDDAIVMLQRDLGIEEPVRLDHDTKGEAGCPDIAATIFSKIDRCAAFVADVTPVGTIGDQATPNPNVLVELGYALRAVGTQRVILVHNVALGTPDLLPFDLRGKRVTTFHAVPNTDNKKARAQLASRFCELIKLALENATSSAPSTTDSPDAAIKQLMDRDALPLLGATPLVFRGQPQSPKGVGLKNISKTVALDLKVAVVVNNEPRGIPLGDLSPGEERQVRLAGQYDPFPQTFGVLYTTPSGHRLTQMFVADESHYNRATLSVRDRYGIHTA